MGIETIAMYAAAALAIGSEIVGLNPKWKSNSIIQLLGNLLKRLAGK